MFTERCLEVLSRKKKGQGAKQESQMQAMMNRIILNYKQTHVDSKLEILKSCEDSPIIDAKGQAGYSKFSSYEDKIEIFRMANSSELTKNIKSMSPRKSATARTTTLDWKLKPDVTGIRMNNRIIKSQTHDIQGVTCMSLPISEVPMLKRHSMIIPHTATFEPVRNISTSYTSRRKVSINRESSQKFMPIANASGDPDSLYMKKLKSFLDFIFKINYSNQIYIPLQLSNGSIKKYKAYVGNGNNSLLVKSLLKRRFWIELAESIDEEGINFYWTQNTVKKVHLKQKVAKNIKVIPPKIEAFKRREQKNGEEKEQIELNKKILSTDDCYRV